MQQWQNLQVEMTSNSLSGQYELMVHQTVDVKEFWEPLTAPHILLSLSAYEFHTIYYEVITSLQHLKAATSILSMIGKREVSR
jgi:hypothetical protein